MEFEPFSHVPRHVTVDDMLAVEGQLADAGVSDEYCRMAMLPRAEFARRHKERLAALVHRFNRVTHSRIHVVPDLNAPCGYHVVEGRPSMAAAEQKPSAGHMFATPPELKGLASPSNILA